MCLYANIKAQFQRRDKIGRNIQRQAFRNEIIASLFLFVRNEQRSLPNTKPDTNPFKNHKSADNMSINKTIMSPPDYIVSCCILTGGCPCYVMYMYVFTKQYGLHEKILKLLHITYPIYFQNKGGGGFSCEES